MTRVNSEEAPKYKCVSCSTEFIGKDFYEISQITKQINSGCLCKIKRDVERFSL